MPSDKPNLLVLLCDQLQRNVLDIYGGPVQTRAWRRLAETGARWDRFYCACPLCIPTRPSMMTGTWPHSHGATSFGKGHDTIHAGQELLIDRLQDAGWQVAFEGIWHINRPEKDDRREQYDHFKQRSFPYADAATYAEKQGIDPAALRGSVRTPTDAGEHHDWTFSVPVPVRWDAPVDDHADMQAAHAIADFIRQKRDAPFAAWASFGAPHPPIVVPEPYFSLFDPDEMAPPPGFEERASAARPADTRENAPGWQSVADWDWPTWARAIAGYLGYAAFADHCMAVVLNALDEVDGDRTLVIATGDHGEMLGAHGLYQKGVLYDRSCRLAAVMTGLDTVSGPRGQLASHTDLAPTILDLLGLPPMKEAQGHSLAAVLSSPQAATVPYQFVEFNGYILGGIHTRAAVSCNYKYIAYEDGSEQLFDLLNDPDELTNLVSRPGLGEVRRAHRAALAEWMHKTNDTLSMPAAQETDV